MDVYIALMQKLGVSTSFSKKKKKKGRKSVGEGVKQVWSLVSVLEGEITAELLTKAFRLLFLWGDEWLAKDN